MSLGVRLTEADGEWVRLTVAEAEALLRLIVICVEHADQRRCTWTDIRQALDQLPQGLVRHERAGHPTF